jgi:hypothetical protein
MQYFPYSQEKLFGELQQCLSFSPPLLQIIGEYSLSWVDDTILKKMFLIPINDGLDGLNDIGSIDDTWRDLIQEKINYSDEEWYDTESIEDYAWEVLKRKINYRDKESSVSIEFSNIIYMPCVSEDINKLCVIFLRKYNKIKVTRKKMIKIDHGNWCISPSDIYKSCKDIYNEWDSFLSSDFRYDEYDKAVYVSYKFQMNPKNNILEIIWDIQLKERN